MNLKLTYHQSQQPKSSFNLVNYVVNLQQHMTDSGFKQDCKQDLNYQFQAQLELLASRQIF